MFQKREMAILHIFLYDKKGSYKINLYICPR